MELEEDAPGHAYSVFPACEVAAEMLVYVPEDPGG